MATSSDIITLSAQSRVPPLGAPISLNTVCTLYGGGGEWVAWKPEHSGNIALLLIFFMKIEA